MAKPERPWTVETHSAIDKIDDNLWSITGQVPGAPITRRMSIIKLADGRLLFYHAIPVNDATLAEITAWGKPSILVLAHDGHCIDAAAFQKKLGLAAYGPKANQDKLGKRVTLSGSIEELVLDDSVLATSVAGTKTGEVMLVVKSGGGARVSLLFADAIQNNPVEKTILPFRILGFAGGPKVVPVFKLLFASDKKALRADLDKWADTPQLARLIPFHGTIVTSDAAGALRAASAAI